MSADEGRPAFKRRSDANQGLSPQDETLPHVPWHGQGIFQLQKTAQV